ncbi:MAG: AmmeMemoRadiSam system protein A, partial [Moorella sp. (in: Bacteria)]|nr:AmmeMemoRadiSam system protein A [Moorella sp. (in: firmicutes)]
MGRLLDVAFMPHPPIMVPEVGGQELEKIRATVAAARELAARLAACRPEVVVIISPHGPVFRDAVGLWATGELKGDLKAFRAGDVRFSYRLDLDLSRAIADAAREADLPLAWLDTAACRRYGLTPELDHGMMVPLYYLRRAGIEAPLVALGMAFLDREQLYAFGAALGRAIETSPRRAVLVASGDLSHRLLPGAPAGYDPRGKEFDVRVKELLAALDVEGVLAIPEELAERAGECGLRSFIMGLG